MNKYGLSAWVLSLALLSPALQAVELNYPQRYMGAPTPLATGPKGALINAAALKDLALSVYTQPTVQKLADGVWVIGGYSIVNCYVIEAPEGLIVYDTGDSAEEGRQFRAVIEQQISRKPVKAIIYSHSHYAMGAGALVDDPASVEVIGNPAGNAMVAAMQSSGGAPAAIPEIGPVLTARAMVQFNNYLPKEGEDAALAMNIEWKEPAYLPITRPMGDGEKLRVAGLELQFFNTVTDDPSLTVWIPQLRLVLNNSFWPGTPNLYSLRGAVYRDPQVWRNGLRRIRDLQPELLLSTHALPISGKQQVHEAVTRYMDLITLTYDQSLRGILLGLSPDELRYFLYKPRSLAEPAYNSEIYGESQWFMPASYYYQMGWYDDDAASINKLPPQEEARRLVALIGGRDKLVAAAREALDRKEYAWVLQLLGYQYRLDPQDTEVRALRAQTLRLLGHLSYGSIGRAFYLSEARAMEGKVQIARLLPPSPKVIASRPTTFVDYLRVRIDPRRAEPYDQVIAFDFPGQPRVALHVRNGIAEFVEAPAQHYRPADIVLQLSGETWARLFLDPGQLAAAIRQGEVKVSQGDAQQAEVLLGLFDRLESAPAP